MPAPSCEPSYCSPATRPPGRLLLLHLATATYSGGGGLFHTVSLCNLLGVTRGGYCMATGLDQLKHIVVLMMENRSFDHMLGSLKAVNPAIDGVTDQMSNPDTTGAAIKPQPLAEFQSQLDPDPDHHFPAVDLQIFGGDT